MSKVSAWIAFAVAVVGLLACTSRIDPGPTQSPAPTPDVAATVVVQALATLAAVTPGPTVTPPATPAPALIPTPLLAPEPTATPTPRRTLPPTAEPTTAPSWKLSRLGPVRERGYLICAVNSGLLGFGFIDDAGNVSGFDIDLCRAVAAAVLKHTDWVEFRPTATAERGATIQSGEVDMMSNSTTWTSARDAEWGNFAQIMFYDGQGFMVPKSSGVSSLDELEGTEICVQQGTITELNTLNFSNRNNMAFTIFTFPDSIATNQGYLQEQCDALTTDRSDLVSIRSGFESPGDHIILPGTISEEPLGPVAPHGDEQWYDIVKTVMAILIYAEAYGIDSSNVPAFSTGNPHIDRLFGLEGSFGQESLGLSYTVAQDVIRAVGNYGEIYDRHLTPLGLKREGSRNALWSAAPCADCPKGGQIYAAPLR